MSRMPRLDEAKYKYCSTQINLNGTAATRVLMFADMLPDGVLGVEGREDQPHLTVQYGIQKPDVDAIREAVRRVSPFEIVLGKTAMFPPSEHSSGDAPLFVSVKAGTDKLVALRNAIRAVVPVRDSFPTYVPHVCVAYVRTDAARQYVGKDWLDGTVVAVNEIAFSNTEGEHVSIPLGRVSESHGVVRGIDTLLHRLGEGKMMTRDDAIDAAARMTRKQYDATDFPKEVMSYDIARAGARDAGLKLKRNVDIDTRPDNVGAAILKMIDDVRVSKGGKRRHADAYKPRRTVN